MAELSDRNLRQRFKDNIPYPGQVMRSNHRHLGFDAEISAHGSVRVSVTTTPLERILLARNIITLEELEAVYRTAIERGEYTTFGFA
jgi:hypothetical protein